MYTYSTNERQMRSKRLPSSMLDGTLDVSCLVNLSTSQSGSQPSVVFSLPRDVPKARRVTFSMCSETQAMNSGKRIVTLKYRPEEGGTMTGTHHPTGTGVPMTIGECEDRMVDIVAGTRQFLVGTESDLAQGHIIVTGHVPDPERGRAESHQASLYQKTGAPRVAFPYTAAFLYLSSPPTFSQTLRALNEKKLDRNVYRSFGKRKKKPGRERGNLGRTSILSSPGLQGFLTIFWIFTKALHVCTHC
ncbi:hypothetical protein BaRGS_00037337 [Batillaria attramentaria]|uniref:Uncharacterized protein n=1 Tax=Batillaria attramentaria TaxID=370345 RepID=A0ABD0J9W8_9CAEN